MLITEQTIEQEANKLDASTENYELAIAELTRDQPYILAYFFSDAFRMLTPEEQSYMLYLGLVVWKSIQTQGTTTSQITEDQIGQAEEKVWEIMELTSNKKFRERLDPFFDNTEEEDLLAFIEDSLVTDAEDKDDFLTKAGREMIFVGLKTVMNCLI